MEDKPNIIIILVDTLREDYGRDIYNSIKHLGFVRYENAIAPSPWTFPSHASIFTGVYPAFHKAHESKTEHGLRIRLNYPYQITSFLSSLGYTTCLLSANPYIRPSRGFTGFTHFIETTGWGIIPSLLSQEDIDKIKDLRRQLNIGNTKKDIIKLSRYLLFQEPKIFLKSVLGKGLLLFSPIYLKTLSKFKRWPLDKGSTYLINKFEEIIDMCDNSFFAFFNFLEVHEPYFLGDAAQGVRQSILYGKADSELVSKWKILYPNEVKYVTKKIKDLLEILERHNAFENSLIIITSDHGQLLGEYGKLGHGYGLYDEVIRVPLMIKYPQEIKIDNDGDSSIYLGKWTNLVNLKNVILNSLNIRNNQLNNLIKYSDTTFSESYGIGGITIKPNTKKEMENIEKLEKYRIAIYYKNFKGIFNVTDWRFEEIKSYNPSVEVTEDIVKHMKNEVVKFLKTATVTKVPRIKL